MSILNPNVEGSMGFEKIARIFIDRPDQINNVLVIVRGRGNEPKLRSRQIEKRTYLLTLSFR